MFYLTLLSCFVPLTKNMGINDRKEREKEELRQRILQAAVEVFLDKGYENTSIRAIAEKIEYSPTTLYLYYKDKNALLHAVHQWGFHRMFDMFQPVGAIENPFNRIQEQGRLYLKFAFENPGLYDLMFIQKLTLPEEDHDDADWHEGSSAFDSLVHNVKECMRVGLFKEAHPEVLAFTIWAMMHGIATLQIKCRSEKVLSEEIRPNITQLAFEQFTHVLRSYKVGSTIAQTM